MATRRTYRAIAATLAAAISDDDLSLASRAAVADVAKGVADALKAERSAFRYDVFFAACGLDGWGELPNPISGRAWLR